MNDAINGSKEAVDVSIYDVEKCFDALWLEECINDMYEAGLQNDNLKCPDCSENSKWDD